VLLIREIDEVAATAADGDYGEDGAAICMRETCLLYTADVQRPNDRPTE